MNHARAAPHPVSWKPKRSTPMSSSTARQTANAANARLSTGPKTPEGTARPSESAGTPGLTVKDLVIDQEDRDEFDELLAGLQADVSPQGALQEILFDEL